jgi:hypothetical protein
MLIHHPLLSPAAVLLLLVGCGPKNADRDAAPEPDGGSADAAASIDGGGAPEADIEDALSCGMPRQTGTGGRAGELELHEVDTAMFPDALCNDGSPAVLHYRPYRGEANRDRWVISLRGGGTCGTADGCAARWCSCDTEDRCPFAAKTTNFTLDNMSGGGGGSLAGGGVMLRDAARPHSLADYNHVQLTYCSSDAWSGAARGVTFTTTHPRTGEPVTYTLHFLGARILDADLRILRQDGVAPLSYTLDGAATAMPDLDEATEVVIVGDSAGGAGVINNLDLIRDTLREHNESGGGAPEVVGVIDAIVGPDLSRLDWTSSIGAPTIDSYAEFVSASAANAPNVGGRSDASCLSWHAEHRPGTEAECGEMMHVVRHHVTTPFFVRMALLDALISRNYHEVGLEDPELGAFEEDARVFAIVTQRELSAFPMLSESAEEGDAIAVAPGVFAPSCSNHDTIHENTEVFGVTIDPTGTTPYRFFDVFDAWRTGRGAPSAVLSSDPTRMDTTCPMRAP